MALTAAITVAAIFAMAGLSFAAVPLYKAFCNLTGYGGTTQVARAASSIILDRDIQVRFDANVALDLPLEFEPLERAQTLKIGETAIARFRVRNLSSAPVRMAATFNVTPHRAGQYFQKLACFCLEDQTLGAGEDAVFPVVYYVDPEIASDIETEDVSAVTLSYTYHRSLDEAARVLEAEATNATRE